MLRKITELRDFELFATDGELGRVTEFYFDDLDWTILYMVVDTGSWLPGRRVLVSPAALGEADWVERKINVLVTREEIETSPEIDLHAPVTREQEVAYFAHFGWACLWSGELRSTAEIIGLSVAAKDGETIGRVEDLIVDELWAIRYLLLNIEFQREDRKHLLSPLWIEDSDWAESKFFTSLSRENIQSAPIFKPEQTIKRDYEENLYHHYGVKPYWE